MSTYKENGTWTNCVELCRQHTIMFSITKNKEKERNMKIPDILREFVGV